MVEEMTTQTKESPVAKKVLELDVSKVPSTVLARLIEEVRNEEGVSARAYDRVHNRHNRGR